MRIVIKKQFLLKKIALFVDPYVPFLSPQKVNGAKRVYSIYANSPGQKVS